MKEMDAIECGLIKHFDLYELSSLACDRGKKIAKEKGIYDVVDYHNCDVFDDDLMNEAYDVVYWNNALHHMKDVFEAVSWSKKILKPGGVLLMDDYVGATFMQWSDELLEINTRIRESLPRHYLVNPYAPGTYCSTRILRPSVEQIILSDPSECCDSSRIIPSLRHHFPDILIKPSGGGIYHCGLNDILDNIVKAGDYKLLDYLIDVDIQIAQSFETHYAVAIAVKV